MTDEQQEWARDQAIRMLGGDDIPMSMTPRQR